LVRGALRRLGAPHLALAAYLGANACSARSPSRGGARPAVRASACARRVGDG
jgi:hypothetical protein